MADLIDRQAAIEALKRAEALTRAFGYHRVIEAIRELPTAEKKGKWEETDWHTEWYGTEKKCSVCGESMLLTDFRNYCPNCGARMMEESE